MLVSVVIPTHNRGEELLSTLNCLLANDVPDGHKVEIITVDDASASPPAPLLEKVKTAPPFSLSCIRLEENVGPSGARNAGFRAAGGEIVLFMDDDILAPPDLISRHVDAHLRNRDSVVWGRCILPPGSSVARKMLEGLSGDSFDTAEEFLRVPKLASGHLSVERDAFAARGSVYAETLHQPAAEEYELMARLRREGIPIVFASRIVAVHHQSLEIGALCRQQYVHGLGCAEAACRCPDTLEIADLRRIIERSACPPRTPVALARFAMASQMPRRGLLATARLVERITPWSSLLTRVHRAAIAAHFVGGVRDGLRQYGSRGSGADSPQRISRLGGALFAGRGTLASLAVHVPPAPGDFNAAEVHKVLLVCTGLMGDTLMCLPAMSCARTLFPEAEVVGLVTEKVRGLLEMSSAGFDRFIVTSGAPLSLRPAKRRENATLEAGLAAEAFDIAVIFLGDDYAPMLTRAGVPWRVLVQETPYRRLATRRYRIGHRRTWGPEEQFGAWKALGLTPHPGSVTFAPPPSAVSAMEARLRRLRSPIVVLHPFGRTPEQWWPEPAWRALAGMVRQQLGGTAVLVGDAADSFSRGGSSDVEVLGRLPLPELVALFLQAACVVSTDSGPFHLAGTMRRPGVGLFRRSRPEHSGRYSSIDAVIGPGDAACSKQCSWLRCRTLPCAQMAAIPAPTVFAAVRHKVDGQSGSEQA
jgi:ADP-heptose:LPS heptosyltransferase/GT2 family glycosyltransferase